MEGFEGELYQHCQRCMDLVESEQQHYSKEELNQPSLSSLEEESRSMHHSIDMRRIVAGEHVLSSCVLYSDFMHSYTMLLQAMTPRRSDILCKSHGNCWATTNYEFFHSLDVQREISFQIGRAHV